MNQRATGLSASKALTGFLQYKSAEGVSQNTMVAYEHDEYSFGPIEARQSCSRLAGAGGTRSVA